MYRPQFAYSRSPAQFEDSTFSHYFDWTNVPLLNNTALPAGGLLQNIPLQLQTDWPFYVRGIMVQGGPLFPLLSPAPATVQVRFKDPFSHDLSNDFVPVGLYVAPSTVRSISLAIIPTIFVRNNPLMIAFEPEVRSPAGAVWWLSIRNPTATTQDLTQVRITLSGVKRSVNGGGGCAS
jgi:hypothetical protein